MNQKINALCSKTVRKRTFAEPMHPSAKECANSAITVTPIVMILPLAVTTALSWIKPLSSAMPAVRKADADWIKPIIGLLPLIGTTEPFWLNQETVSTFPRKI